MSKLPRFSYDLVTLLDQTYPHVVVPTYMWTRMGQDQVRDYCYRAGMRAVVDDLLEIRDKDEDEDNV